MTPEREAQIRLSTDAVFVATDSLFANPAYKEDLDLARSLQKPILWLLQANARVPQGTIQIGDRVAVWTTPESFPGVANKALFDLHGNIPCEVINGVLPDVPRET